jgi:hypothetical protein
MSDELKQKLKDLLPTLEPTKAGSIFYVDRTCPYTDYCKEVSKPGENANYADGVTALRVDDDFWAVVTLPYEFKDLATKDIVDIVFPDAKDPTYEPDSGTIEQLEKRRDIQIESYKRCCKYFLDKGISQEEVDKNGHCNYDKEMIGYYNKAIEEKRNEDSGV